MASEIHVLFWTTGNVNKMVTFWIRVTCHLVTILLILCLFNQNTFPCDLTSPTFLLNCSCTIDIDIHYNIKSFYCGIMVRHKGCSHQHKLLHQTHSMKYLLENTFWTCIKVCISTHSYPLKSNSMLCMKPLLFSLRFTFYYFISI